MLEVMVADVARKEYAERVKRGEFNYRLAQSHHHAPGPLDKLLLSLGQWLILCGEGLRQRVEMRPGLSQSIDQIKTA